MLADSLISRLTSVLGRQGAMLELRSMKEALKPSDPPTRLVAMLERRLQGEPLQYILGSMPFGPLNLLCRPPTLIPRPETAVWVSRLASIVSPSNTRPLSVLDLCTGSGCIPLLLCHLLPSGSAHAIGVDVAEDAIKLATDNAARCDIATARGESDDNSRNVFTPVVGDICDPDLLNSLPAPFDLITANPPYIPRKQYDELPPTIKDYEDRRALLGDLPGSHDGLSFYHLIARFLAQKGVFRDRAIVAFEVGDGTAQAVESILHKSAGLKNTETWTDPLGKQCVVLART